MKRIFATLIFALPLLFCGCSEEEDILPEQRQKIVSYLERTHSPALIPESQVEAGSQQRFYSMSGSTVYRYIDNFYRDGRSELPEVTAAAKATITFRAKTDGKAEMDKMIAQKASKLTLMARSKKTAKLNIKVVVKGDLKAITDAGYTVKYKFYRSTKKSAGYKAVLTKKAPTYFNTYGKKGTMYYYKARVMIYDKDGNFVAQTALKQCKYANRLWTK